MTRFGIGAFGWCVANCGACSFILWHTVKCAMNVILYFCVFFCFVHIKWRFRRSFRESAKHVPARVFLYLSVFLFRHRDFLILLLCTFYSFSSVHFFFNRVALLLLFMQPIDPNISKHWNKFACRRRKRDIHRSKRARMEEQKRKRDREEKW